MISTHDHDSAMHFENLARKVFKCDRAADPWEYATADKANVLYEPSEDGKMVLYTIIDIAIYDNKENYELVKGLLNIKNLVLKTSKKGELLKSVHSIIELLNKHGY